jgi:hypothetical protein
MIEGEVLMSRSGVPRAPSDAMGTGSAQTGPGEADGGPSFCPIWRFSGVPACLRQRGPCGKNRPRPDRAFPADSL